MTEKKSITFGDLLINGGQIALAGFGYYVFGNAAIDDVKQIAENVSVKIKEDKKPVINLSEMNFGIINPTFRLLRYKHKTR